MTAQTRRGRMTPAQWLASRDLGRMLWAVGLPASAPQGVPPPFVVVPPRRLRLFACACARTAWGLLSARGRDAVAVAEAHGLGPMAYRRAIGSARRRLQRAGGADAAARWCCLAYAAEAAWQCASRVAARPGERDGEQGAALLRCVLGNPFRHEKLLRLPVVPDGTRRAALPSAAPAGTLRCTCGFDSPCPLGVKGQAPRCTREHLDDAGIVLASGWLTPQALALALAARSQRLPDGFLDPLRLRVLADCLEEGGCPQERTCADCGGDGKAYVLAGGRRVLEIAALARYPGSAGSPALGDAPREREVPCGGCGGTGRVPFPLLSHLRAPGPHALGCWAVDIVLEDVWP